MEKTKEFDKAWKKTCPTCKDNPSNILYYKKQCSACEDKDAKAKKYTLEDIENAYQDGWMSCEKWFEDEELSDWDVTLNDGLEDESHPE